MTRSINTWICTDIRKCVPLGQIGLSFYTWISMLTKKDPNYWYCSIYAGVKKNFQFANLRCVKYLAQKYGCANSLTNFILAIKTACKTCKTIDKTTDIVPLLLSPTCQGRLCLRLGVALGQLVAPRTGSLFCQLAGSLPALWDPHMPHPLQDMPLTQLFSKTFGYPSEHKTESQQKILELEWGW